MAGLNMIKKTLIASMRTNLSNQSKPNRHFGYAISYIDLQLQPSILYVDVTMAKYGCWNP